MPTTTTIETQARSAALNGGGAFGYLDRDGRFIASINRADDQPKDLAHTPATSEEQSTVEFTSTPPTELPENPRDLISMAFYVNVSSLEPNLYLGNLQVACSTRYRTEHRISHVVSVCKNPVPADWPESGQQQLRIAVEDEDHEDLLIHFQEAAQFIHNALSSGGTVLIHSERGQSRSATIAAAYYMWRDRIGAAEALERVRMAREQIWVRPGFQEQLVLFALCQYAPGPEEGIYRSWRTRRDNVIAGIAEAERQARAAYGEQ